MSYPGQKYKEQYGKHDNAGYPGSVSQPPPTQYYPSQQSYPPPQNYPPYPPPQAGYGPPPGPPPSGGYSAYAPPPGPPPSQGSYLPPPGPPPSGGYGAFAPPPGPPPSQGSYPPPPGPPPSQDGYAQPSYAPPPYPPTQGSYPPPTNPPPNEVPSRNQQYQPPPGPPPSQDGYVPPAQGGYAPPPYPPTQGSYPPPTNPPPNEVPSRNQQYQLPPGPPPSNSYIQHPSSGYTPPPGYNLYQNTKAKPASNVQLSNCTGVKRALLIGINYIGTQFELKGCINDVSNIKKFLIELYGFRESDMVILTDDQKDQKKIPTRENILAAMKWLVHDARPNDSYFFHFSGHGGQAPDIDGDEDDGYDETIMPLDFQKKGQIIDDEMHDIMVKPLPPGVRLTAVFDSCHSGTALDLPYIYSTQGKVKEPNLLAEGHNAIMNAGMSYLRGDFNGIKTSLLSLGKKATSGKNIAAKNKQKKSSLADVVMFSGCKDGQTSADTNEAGVNTGAMSYALITTLRANKNLSYQQMLNSIRDILAAKYSQKPQLSASHEMDMNAKFII